MLQPYPLASLPPISHGGGRLWREWTPALAHPVRLCTVGEAAKPHFHLPAVWLYQTVNTPTLPPHQSPAFQPQESKQERNGPSAPDLPSARIRTAGVGESPVSVLRDKERETKQLLQHSSFTPSFKYTILFHQALSEGRVLQVLMYYNNIQFSLLGSYLL